MGVFDFNSLYEHLGHQISLVTYGSKANGKGHNLRVASEVATAAIECEDCDYVLLEFDNPRLLGILLPTYPRSDRSKYNHRTIPPRLHDNIECGFASIHNWSEDAETVQGWIHQAYLRKSTKQPDNSRASFGKNRTGTEWND